MILDNFSWIPVAITTFLNVSKWKLHSEEAFLEFLPSLKCSFQAFSKFYYLPVVDLFIILPALSIPWNPTQRPLASLPFALLATPPMSLPSPLVSFYPYRVGAYRVSRCTSENICIASLFTQNQVQL